jgi:hypothetical protein
LGLALNFMEEGEAVAFVSESLEAAMFRWLARLLGVAPPPQTAVAGQVGRREEQAGEGHPEDEHPIADYLAATGVSWTEVLDEPLTDAESSAPWPAPLAPGTVGLTFRGTGSRRSGKFTLAGDGALRVLADGGPFRVRVEPADGRTRST